MGAAALVVETRRRGARPRPAADLRGARRGHRQQRLPRHPARRRAHRRGDGEPGRRRRGARGHRAAHAPRAAGLRLARDLHARRAAAAPRPRSTRCAASSAPAADRIVIANTKGFTGHPMGVGIEDVVAVKSLETGLVPPVPNYRELDPELGALNLSRGGAYPVRYALRLAAGFGSQISMTLLRWVPPADGRHRAPAELGYAYRIADPRGLAALARHLAGHAAARSKSCTAAAHCRPRRTRRIAPRLVGAGALCGPPGGAARDRRVRAPAVAAQPAPAAAQRLRPSWRPRVRARRCAAPRSRGACCSDLRRPASRRGAGAGDGHRGADDRLSARHAGSGPRPRSRPRRRHGQAGRGVRGDARALRHRARRQPQAARLPDLAPRRQLVRQRGGLGAAHRPLRRSGRRPSLRRLRRRRRGAGRGRGRRDRARDRHRRRDDRLPGRPAGPRPRPRSRPRRRHRQAGRGVRRRARALRLERDPNLKLRDFPTLRHVAGWVRDRAGWVRPGRRAAAPAPAAGVAAPAAARRCSAVRPRQRRRDRARDRDRRRDDGLPGRPAGPDLDLEADLGVDTVKQAEVFAAVRGHYGSSATRT